MDEVRSADPWASHGSRAPSARHEPGPPWHAGADPGSDYPSPSGWAGLRIIPDVERWQLHGGMLPFALEWR